MVEKINNNLILTKLYTMKKLFILIFAVTFIACNAPAEQEGAGFFIPQPGEKFVVASVNFQM